MPTKLPRFSVTLPPDTDRILRSFADLTGKSKSALIAELLTDAMPHLERVCVALQHASAMQGEARAATIERFGKFADLVTAQASSVLATSDLFVSSVSAPAPKAAAAAGGGFERTEEHEPRARRRPTPKAPPPAPPLVNKGGEQSPGGGSKVVKIGKGRAGR